jgi:hypothetical protein
MPMDMNQADELFRQWPAKLVGRQLSGNWRQAPKGPLLEAVQGAGQREYRATAALG